MSPHLHLNFFNRTISAFHFFGVLGFILGTLQGVTLYHCLNLQVLVILLMSLTGATTFFILAFLAKILTGKEVIVYYHHEIAILIICLIILKALALPVLVYLDVTILGIATFLGFGRIGCFSVGCCHGKPAKKGVIYSHEHVQDGFTNYYEDVPLFPVQLIESAFLFVIITVGTLFLLWHFPPGTFLIFYTTVYGVFRFINEFFRGDAERTYFKGLSEAQWTTLLLIGVSIVFALLGFIPFYAWHMVIFILLLIISLFIVIRNDIGFQIINPRHVKQIAMGLNKLKAEEASVIYQKNSPVPINVFQTNLGLSLSQGHIDQGGTKISHYTVAFKKNKKITYPVVSKLATVIRQLEKHRSPFEIYEKQNAVFHIVFKE